MTTDRWFYIPEVAEKLRRSTRSVEWLIASGQLTAGKLAGRRVVRERDLEEFIARAWEAA